MSAEAFKQILSNSSSIQQAVTRHAVNDLANAPEAAGATDAKGFFGQLVSGVAQDIGAELGRLGVQGQAELAGALFNGNAYVPYGEGQKVMDGREDVQQEAERGGREM